MMGSELQADGTSRPRMSLQEEAQQRADSIRSSQGNGRLAPASFQSPHPLQATPRPVSQQQQPPSSASLAEKARQDWRRHGTGLSQATEDKRMTPTSSSPSSTALVVRVISAEDKVDAGGATYTAYVLSVQSSTSSHMIQHRYGEFSKLQALLQEHKVRIDTLFPAKHWAGRLGHWTPSTWLSSTQSQHDDLVQYRQVQLDLWSVDVVDLYNRQELPHTCQQAVYDFLFHAEQPPCHDLNTATTRTWTNPLSFTLGSSLRQAASTVRHMCGGSLSESDQSIPLDLLHQARGLCFLTVVKAGMVVSGKVGTGCLISKLSERDTWSAPCALATLGLGWGAQIGGDLTEYLIILTSHTAVESLCRDHSVHLGAEMNVAIGPLGRGVQMSSSAALQPAYAYAHAQGLFVGMSLEGSVLKPRHDVNAKFYGTSVSPQEVLIQRTIQPPRAADPLYEALAEAMQATIPSGGIRPSQYFGGSSVASGAGPAVNTTSQPVGAATSMSNPAGHASMFSSTSS